MELDSYHPTDAEAWDYIVQHGDRITDLATHRVRNAMFEVLKDKWEAQGIARLNLHDFALIWLDPRYKSLATRLVKGTVAEVFDIGTIYQLKKCRLEGVSSNCTSLG